MQFIGRIALAKQSTYYVGITMLTALIAFIAIPFFTKVLSPSEYAIAGIFQSLVFIVSLCLELSILTRRAFVISSDKANISDAMIASSLASVIAAIVLCLIIMACWSLFSPLIPLGLGWVLAGIGAATLQTVALTAFALWQMSQAIWKYCVFRVVLSVSYLFIAMLGLYVFSMGWQAIAIAYIVSSVASVAIIVISIRRDYQIILKLSSAKFRVALSYLMQVLPHKLAAAIFLYSGPLLIVYYIDANEGGIYVLAAQLAMINYLIFESIQTAIIPHLMTSAKGEISTTPHAKHIIRDYCAIVILVALAFALVAPVAIEIIFPESYARVPIYIPWMAAAACLHGFTRLIQQMIFISADSYKSISFLSVISAVVYVAATILLLNNMGAIGGGIGLLIGQAFWLLAMAFCRVRQRSSATQS